MKLFAFVLFFECSKELLCDTVSEGEDAASNSVEIARNGQTDNDGKLMLVLEEILGKVNLLQQESCISVLRTPHPKGSPYFTPKLKEFYSWMLSSNTSMNRLDAALLVFITEEHARTLEDMRRYENRMTLNNLEESKSNLLTLKNLGRNLTTEMLAFTAQVKAFEENLQNTLRKVGCSGSTISIVDGKFCRNQKWFYPVGAYVGSADDFSSISFRLTRLKLFGQMWNLKSAGGNLAILRITNSPSLTTSENLKQLIDVAESIEIFVLLEVGKIALNELTEILESIKDSPMLVGISIKSDRQHYLESLWTIETIRPDYPFLMFSLTFTCRTTYLSSMSCQRGCYSTDIDLDRCLSSCNSPYEPDLDDDYYETSTSCDNYPDISMKSHIERALDFVIANDVDYDPAITSLKAIVNLPTVFQGLKKAASFGVSDAPGFTIDAEVTDRSHTLKLLQSLRDMVANSYYERLTSA